MASLFVLVSIFFCIVATLYLIKNLNRRADIKLPPGYRSWSIIGDTLSLLRPCSPTSLGDFLVHGISRYGKIFTINFLGKPMIVSADQELNRFVLQNDVKMFENTWDGPFRRVIGESSIAMQMGDDHKRLKSIYVTFFSTAKLRNSSFQQNVDKIATEIFGSWRHGSVISAFHAAKKFSYNIMVKRTLSMEPGEPETMQLETDVARLTSRIFFFPLNLPGTHYNKLMQSRANILKIINRKIQERTNGDRNREAELDDLLGWMLKNTSLSKEQMGDLLLGVFFAGDTTSTAIAMMVRLLAGLPKAINQLREERSEVDRSKQGGESRLTWEDYKKMEFTQCVINEVLRLGNPARLLMKKTSTHIQFKGYEIPRGCRLITYISAGHLDPSLFEDPEHFNPWRWLSSSGIKRTNNFMPFGGGQRICPGAELARFEMAVFLHHLIHNYNWKLIGDDCPTALPPLKFQKGLPIQVYAAPKHTDEFM